MQHFVRGNGENGMLPADLVEAIRDGRVVPFLGAGASFGATDGTGKRIPLAATLKGDIAAEFLGGGFEEATFATVCDFAASARDVRTLQAFIYEKIHAFGPAEYHLLLPTFRWAGIATTNYDLVVEHSYRAALAAETAAQSLLPYCRDADNSLERLSDKSVLYVKLHGCITNYQIVEPPLVASTEQLINHREGRTNQFKQFLEWGQTKTLIFAGYGMGDPNLRAIFEELHKEGDKRPRHFMVRPNIPDVEINYWADRRVTALSMSFEEFLKAAAAEISNAARTLSSLAAAKIETSFTRFIAVSGRPESNQLKEYIQGTIEHVTSATASGDGDPAKFYAGFDLGWYPYANKLDAPRRIGSAIFAEQVTSTEVIRETRFVVVKAHAGGGKTVVLRRLAWDAAHTSDRIVFFVRRPSDLDADKFDEMVSLTNATIYLVVDNVTEDADHLATFLKKAKLKKWPMVIFGGARINEWNVKCDSISPYVDYDYEIEYLNNIEVDSLLDHLRDHNALGDMASLSAETQRDRLRNVFGRQILVALHEATHNKSFRDIIASEYAGIVPTEAQLLYRDVCLIHRLGPPVRAGLISRLHGIAFDEFKERFFRPLEQVIHSEWDRKSGDFIYKSRHSYISEMVYELSFPTTNDRFEAIVRLISKLNPGYTYDQEVLSEIIRAGKLAETFPDRTMGEAIYEAAEKSLGRDAFVLHQHGIYEMRLSGDSSALDRAENLLRAALELKPGNAAIRHSLAELSLKRSLVSKDSFEREAWRRRAESEAALLARQSNSSHSTHTLAKAAIGDLRDALDAIDVRDDDLAQESLNQSIKKAEETIRSGLQRFPNDDRLLNEEATLNQLLSRADLALKSLRKAFEANPKSELICRRLAKILLAKENAVEAKEVLRLGLERNPGSQSLHYEMANALRLEAHDADVTNGSTIAYHLQRSFALGDKHYEAQFWYARQLCLIGKSVEARGFFERLKTLPFPYAQKSEVRGIVKSPNGNALMVYGTVSKTLQTFGFLRSDLQDIEAYFRFDPDNTDHELLRQGDRVCYELGFNFSGPIGICVNLANH